MKHRAGRGRGREDEDGLYTANPKTDPDATLIESITDPRWEGDRRTARGTVGSADSGANREG